MARSCPHVWLAGGAACRGAIVRQLVRRAVRWWICRYYGRQLGIRLDVRPRGDSHRGQSHRADLGRDVDGTDLQKRPYCDFEGGGLCAVDSVDGNLVRVDDWGI